MVRREGKTLQRTVSDVLYLEQTLHFMGLPQWPTGELRPGRRPGNLPITPDITRRWLLSSRDNPTKATEVNATAPSEDLSNADQLPDGAFNRLISAYLSGVLRVCASQTILVSRLARRSRRRREAPSGNVRRNISRMCCVAWSASTSPGRSARLEFDCFGWGARCRGWERAS